VERRVSVTDLRSQLALAACLQLAATCALAADALVLVVRTDSPVQALDSLAVRKAFIGFTVSAGSAPLRPLVNATEPSLRAAFLQHVVGLSPQMYQRRTLTLVLQQGLAPPVVLTDQQALLRALRSSPYAVTFMWQSAADRLDGIRIVRTLWHE
jgi:hypothetical protein